MANLNIFLITLILPFLVAGVSSSTSSVCITGYTHTSPNQDTYQTNLQALFAKFRTKEPGPSNYRDDTAGESPDRAYGIYLCRGDTTSDLCSTCVASLTDGLSTDGCREGFAYTDDCMVHYADYSFLGKANNTVPGIQTGKPDPTDFGEYNRTVEGVVDALVAEVGDINAVFAVRYGTREASVGNGREKVYGLAQCTPVISQGDCRECLKAAFSAIQGCCGGTKFAWAVLPSCQLRYDDTSFYAATESTPAATAISPAVSPTFLLVATWGLLINWLFVA